MKTDVGVRGFFFSFLPTEGAANATMDVEIVEHEEDSASAGRGEGGADGRAPARPSGGDGRAEHDSAPCLHGVPPEGRAPFEALTG